MRHTLALEAWFRGTQETMWDDTKKIESSLLVSYRNVRSLPCVRSTIVVKENVYRTRNSTHSCSSGRILTRAIRFPIGITL
jgi:hypothetical protein